MVAEIYIPVWIDLKTLAMLGEAALKGIYIPVWIDLKWDKDECARCVYDYLHSSMDRFEAGLYIKYVIIIVHLHSSMDRFEELCT